MQATGPTASNSERPAARGRSKSANCIRTAHPVLAKRSVSAHRAAGKREHAHAQDGEPQVSWFAFLCHALPVQYVSL